MSNKECNTCKWYYRERCYLNPLIIVYPHSLNNVDYKRPYVISSDFCSKHEEKEGSNGRQ